MTIYQPIYLISHNFILLSSCIQQFEFLTEIKALGMFLPSLIVLSISVSAGLGFRKCPKWYTDDNTPRCIAPDKVSDITDQLQCRRTKYCCVGQNGVCYAVRKKNKKTAYEESKSNEKMENDATAIVSMSQTQASSRSLLIGTFPSIPLPYGGEEPYPGFSKLPEFVCQPKPKFPGLCDVNKFKTVQFVRAPPMNIPYCQRIPCDPARPKLDNHETDCRATPGCFYDRSLGDYRKRFGHSIMPGVPVCHLAIRNSVFLEEARKVKTETGKWSPFLNQCLLETFNQVIRTPKDGCRLLSMLEYFEHKPKLAGWKGITDYECFLINGCWVENKGCYYAVDPGKLSIQSSPTAQEAKMSGALYYGRPPCQNFNKKTAKSSIESYHNCLISGCRLDPQAQDSYYNYLYDFGKDMSAADHWVFWRMVESGKYGAHNLREYEVLPKQDITVTPFSLVISYADNSSENSLLRELQQKSSASLLESIKSLSGLELAPQQGGASDPFFETMQSLQTPCSQTFTSFGGRPCGPPDPKPVDTPDYCPYRAINERNMKPLEGSIEGCCDITFCFHNKDDIREAKSGATSYYSIWSYWTECSTTCGPGIKTRRRSCIGVDQSICKGNVSEEATCQVAPCSYWSTWGRWSLCPVTCNTGIQSRTRTCIPSGSFCPGNWQEVRECGTGFCQFQGPVYGTWTSWDGSCSPCGDTRSRSRQCISGNCDQDKLFERRACANQCGRPVWSQWVPVWQCTPKFQESGCHQMWALVCRDANGLETQCETAGVEFRDCAC